MADILNLSVTFDGQVSSPPYTDPALLAGSSAACRTTFNAGTGFVEYVDASGGRHRLDRAEVDAALDRISGSPDPSIWERIQRILEKRCTEWTQEELDFMLQDRYPTHLGGWILRWECQELEGGSGMSVRDLRAGHDGAIRSFELNFDIDVTCVCLRNRRSAISKLFVRLKYP
ncbi:MAG TPA: hypothetical protein VJU81_23760 [Methylomirabilota bacterium]|nr:hypothetical protein [Methylomirabilota bacterium]